MDGSISALEALPGCVAAVRAACEASGRPADAVPVFMDSGVRYGQHVLKAKALGATAVLYGRPVMMSLTLGGEEGVSHTLLNLLVSCIVPPARDALPRASNAWPARRSLAGRYRVHAWRGRVRNVGRGGRGGGCPRGDQGERRPALRSEIVSECHV